MQGVMWNTEGGEVKNWATQRNLNYQAQLNWARSFGKHNVTLMGLAIFVSVVIFNLLGDTIRDYMDPKNTRSR